MAHLGNYKKRKMDRDVYGIKAKEHIDVLEQTRREAAKGKGSKSFGLPAKNTMQYQKGMHGMRIHKYQEGAEVLGAEDETRPAYGKREMKEKPPMLSTVTLTSDILPEIREWEEGETYDVHLTVRQTSEPGDEVTFEVTSAEVEPEEETEKTEVPETETPPAETEETETEEEEYPE